MRPCFAGYLIIVLLSGFTACSGPRPGPDELAQTRYGSEYSCSANAEETHVLCSHETNLDPGPLNPETPVSFFLYSSSDRRIILEERIENGHVSWLSSDTLKVERLSGIISTDPHENRLGYLFVLSSGRKLEVRE